MSRKGRRLFFIGLILSVFGLALGMILFALRGSVSLFLTPTELAERQLNAGARLRLGGLVKEGSVVKLGPQSITFVITDGTKDVGVSYKGIIPDLFREGQGVVAEGLLTSPSASGVSQLRADSVLAKHDENYMPREIAESLKKQGVWQGGSPTSSPTSPPRP
jgi:cytochrome c-type biogenesis protein CcmE